MKIGIPLSKKIGGGAGNFFKNLRKEIELNRDIEIVSPFNWTQDVGLYSSVRRGLPWLPYCLRLDGIYYDKNNTHGDNADLNKRIYKSIKNASGIIFQSNFSKKLVESHYGEIDSLSTVILNGSSIYKKINTHEKKRKKRIICSADWRVHKRFNAIVETVRKLRKNIDCELIVLGDVDKIQTFNEGYIKYLGHLSNQDVLIEIQKSDVFIHLCWLDVCPNAVIEAVACGVPVVCSNLGGTPEIIESTMGGCIANCDYDVDISGLLDMYNPPFPDIDEIVRATEYLFNNYQYIVDNMVHSEINISLSAKKYVNFLKNVVDS